MVDLSDQKAGRKTKQKMNNNIFITTTWHTMDTLEVMAEKKGFPLQDSALYKKINRMINRWAEGRGESEILKFNIAYLLGVLIERVKNA